MIKKYALSVILLFSVSISPALADTDIHSRSLSEVKSEIFSSQNIDNLSSLDCDQVTAEQFREAGEALMSVMHPDETEHSLMDQMMGGEGSDSLRAAHVLMGQKYLGCSYDSNFSGFMGTNMMSGGLMNGPTGYGMMSGWNNGYWFGWLAHFSLFILIILGIIYLLKLIKRK